MAQFKTSDIRAKLFPSKIGDPKNFEVLTQQGGLKQYSGIGVRYLLSLFEDNGAAGVLYDVSNLSSVTLVVHPKNDLSQDFMLKTLVGPFTNITSAQFNAGTHWHFEFAYSSTDAALEPGDYVVAVFGNTSDPLAEHDFYCEAELTVKATGIPVAYAQPASEATVLGQLLLTLEAKLGDYAKKVMAPGETITFQDGAGVGKRILGITYDVNMGPQPVDALEGYPEV